MAVEIRICECLLPVLGIVDGVIVIGRIRCRVTKSLIHTCNLHDHVSNCKKIQ